MNVTWLVIIYHYSMSLDLHPIVMVCVHWIINLSTTISEMVHPIGPVWSLYGHISDTSSKWMLLLNCQEMCVIELFNMSFLLTERSGLPHFPIIIDIIQ